MNDEQGFFSGTELAIRSARHHLHLQMSCQLQVRGVDVGKAIVQFARLLLVVNAAGDSDDRVWWPASSGINPSLKA